MRLSAWYKTRREAPSDEESINAQLLIRAGYVDKLQAGVYTFLPLGFRVLKKIENLIRDEMEGLDASELLLPSLHPKANWVTTDRYDNYDSLFRFLSHFSKIDYVLGPTHEEVISPLAQKFITSYKDLPTAAFQIQNKFRDEKRAKSGILRGREFFMKDLYSFHTDDDDLERYYQRVSDAYRKIFELAGIGGMTYLTYASGGSFSKYSHEFQTLTSAGEDTIYICGQCRIAINKEIIVEQDSCPQCGNKELKEEKAIEVGNIFKLGTRFSEPFGLHYTDADGNSHPVVMGCYGIGITRLMGTIVEVHHDERGIVWPENIAPYKVYLVGLSDKAQGIYERLRSSAIEVLFDDRDVSAGQKFSDADLIGLPYRVVVSEKTGDQVEIKGRSDNDARLVSFEELLTVIGSSRTA